MKCNSCEKKEFSFVFESHKPIQDQPAIICYECFCEYLALKEDAYDEEAEPAIEKYARRRAKITPRKCC